MKKLHVRSEGGYTKLRKFYAWVGFIVTVIVFSIVLSLIIHYWSQTIVNHSLPQDINTNLA
ncbi:MAG: hypothetical protein V4509_04590 [Patescibacteria group bacterium]